MPGFLVATRLQNLCGEPNQLAKVLRDKDGKEVQIPGTKMLSGRAFLDTLVLYHLRLAFMACYHISFVAFHFI
jgi:hypothetical protein